ncbi:unnamed protein product [Commensalibacter communis]|nr:unnamed protein product [Commensalibacter communis]CAI3953893.1 unnamed protein product [Commensalibacter communis]
MIKYKRILFILMWTIIAQGSSVINSRAYTPSGEWTLQKSSPTVKDYSMRVDVDPGEQYSGAGYAPSSVYWAEYITFNNASGGYLGLQRASGKKIALASIWDGTGAKAGILPTVNCYEFGSCSSIKGEYNWKVGHKYRFRVEKSPRTPSDNTGDWWQISLADLTTGTIDILGELKTPKWNGLKNYNGVFLEYFTGPYQCNSLRHSKTTMGQIKGNYGKETALSSSNASIYGNPHTCGQEYLLPNMTEADHGSTASNNKGTLTLLGNNYRGIHQWGKYQKQAKKGMMFASNPTVAEPYIYEALHDGVYGAFPAKGADNKDWKSIGIGYPIINDLYFRNQRVYEWEELKNSNVKIGDYFIYHNPINLDTEYFKLTQTNPGYFPTDKTNGNGWEYVGRYSRSSENLYNNLPVHTWNDSNHSGKKGELYYDTSTKMYFILKNTGSYWYFPTTATDNQYWQFFGYNP